MSRNVRIIVRANSSNEDGLTQIGGSYDPSELETMGMDFLDVPFADVGAFIPPPALLERVLKRCEDLQAPSSDAAVFVHCKSGFGRSVMYACCLLLSKYDMP